MNVDFTILFLKIGCNVGIINYLRVVVILLERFIYIATAIFMTLLIMGFFDKKKKDKKK